MSRLRSVIMGAIALMAPTLYAQAAKPTPTTTFYAGGASLLPQSSPKPTGWFAIATEINTANKLYSFSETDYTIATGGVIQSSARTGLATPLRSFGEFTVYGLGDAGVASTGTATGAAFAGGGFVLMPIGKTGWNIIVGARVLKTAVGGTQTFAEIGIGK